MKLKSTLGFLAVFCWLVVTIPSSMRVYLSEIPQDLDEEVLLLISHRTQQNSICACFEITKQGFIKDWVLTKSLIVPPQPQRFTILEAKEKYNFV